MRKLIILIFLPFLLSAQHAEERPTLLVFSGSDWCLPCIRFENEVLSQPDFKTFQTANFNLQKADFPQKTKLTDSEVAVNEALAEQYNLEGQFPKVVLLDSKREVISELRTDGQNVQSFIKHIKELLPAREFRRKVFLMGSDFEFVILEKEESRANQLLDDCIEEVTRIERLISSWDSSSEISEVNKNASDKSVSVSEETANLIDRSLRISKMTQGAFDITFGGADFWDFDQNEILELPDSGGVEESLKNIGYQYIELDGGGKIRFTKEKIKVGFGALGKGYAADRVKKMLLEKGVKSGVVNASGDLTAWGKRADGKPWQVGIADPKLPNEALFYLPIENKTVATSGNYEKFFTHKGTRFSHIINPKTGWPVSDKMSVTVISQSAELSDALATALFVMDVQNGLKLINQLPDTECIIIVKENAIHYTKGLDIENLNNLETFENAP